MPKTLKQSAFNQADHHGGNDNCLTPPHIINALGGHESFNLDPCASTEPRPWPTAEQHLAPPNVDGLVAPWYGRIWCNPPYSGAKYWAQRVAEHRNGVLLVFARTETEWFQKHVFAQASGILFLRRRLSFHRPDGSLIVTKQGKPSNAGAPSCLVAYDAVGTAVNLLSLHTAISTGKLVGHLVLLRPFHA